MGGETLPKNKESLAEDDASGKFSELDVRVVIIEGALFVEIIDGGVLTETVEGDVLVVVIKGEVFVITAVFGSATLETCLTTFSSCCGCVVPVKKTTKNQAIE